MKFQLHMKNKISTIKKFLALSLSDVVFIMLINVKMPTIMSRINFTTLGPDLKKQSYLALHCVSRPFWPAIRV